MSAATTGPEQAGPGSASHAPSVFPPSAEGKRYAVPAVTAFAAEAFEHTGMRPEDAAVMADNLVDAEVRGVSTHGLARLAPYIGQMRSGDVALRPEIQLTPRTTVAADVNGGGGFGVLAGIRAVDWAVDAATRFGIGLVGVRDVGHFGTASYYTRRAAAAGMIGIAMTNTSPTVVPAGGAVPRLGNNPLSIAVPNGRGGSGFCLDIAMSVVSRGRVKLYDLAGEAMPAGIAVDADGNPTTDPAAGLDGALLPFGDYKGAGLSMAVEILAAALTGAQLTQQVRHGGFTSSAHMGAEHDDRKVTLGNLYLAIDPGVFRPVEAFLGDVTAIEAWVRSARPRPGQTVMVAGEPESRAEADRRTTGVPLSAAVVAELAEVAAEAGLDPLTPLGGAPAGAASPDTDHRKE